MSSSVLRSVIQPRQIPASIPRAGVEDFGDPDRPPEDMELILGVLVENAPVAMAMFDDQMRYILANRAWVDEFGLTSVQPLIGRSQYEVFPGLHAGWRQVYERALQGHVVRSEHDALSGPDGRRIVYRWEVRPWRRKRDASVGGLMVTCEKFSDVAAPDDGAEDPEDEVAEVASQPPEVLSACAVPMMLLDDQGVVHQANDAAVNLSLARGLQEHTSVFWEIFAEGQGAGSLRQQVLCAMEKLSSPGAPAVEIVVPASALGFAASVPDKDASPCARWMFSVARSSGTPGRFTAIGLPAERGAQILPVSTPNLPAIASAVASISQPPAPSVEGLTSSLELRRLQDDLARARQELRTLHEAERTFTQRDARARQYLEAMPCGVLVLDELGVPIYQNGTLTRLLGRAVGKDETVEHWLASACPNGQHRSEVTTLWRDDVWRRQLTRTFSLATADGLLKELEFLPVGLEGGGLLLSIHDTTEACRHEEQLRATEAKFRTLLHEMPAAIVLMDKAGSVFEVNHAAESLLGHPKSELRRYPLDAWLEPESGSARREAVRLMLMEARRTTHLEVRVRQPQGPAIPMMLYLAQVLNAEGDPHCTVHFFQRVEGRQPSPNFIPLPNGTAFAHAGTSQSVEKAMTPRRTTLLKTNVNGRIKECSLRGQELLGLDADEARGRSLHLHFRPSDATGFYAELTRLSQHPTTAYDLTCYARDGQRHTCRISVSACGGGGFDFEMVEHGPDTPAHAEMAKAPPIFLRELVPASALSSVNLTALSGIEARWPLADLPREKLLLSETHHRIKNHLQIISSLLNLESNSITDTTARNALRSSQNRVRSIAELHQHLYQIALGTGESFATFAGGLVQRLRECYAMPEHRVTIHLDLQVGSIQQEWLMPLALTLNETLSNCFEHAFPGQRAGEIWTSLTFGLQMGELVVADNGIGLSESYRPGTGGGLGLKILAVFAEQMRGQLLLGRTVSGGTEIRLRFPIASADI